MLLRRGSHSPYPLYERIRRDGDLVRSRLRLYITPSHRWAGQILRDPRFGVSQVSASEGVVLPLPPRPPEPVHPIEDSFLSMDPPEHTRLRKLVSPWFTPRALRTRRAEIERVITGYLDELATKQRFDLVPEFAERVPIQVISDLLGVPTPDHERFSAWARQVGPALDGVHSLREQRRLDAVIAELHVFFKELIAHRRRHPGEDMLSQLVQSTVDGKPVPERDLLATAGLLLLAGFGTTLNLIGNGALALLVNRDARERLLADFDLAPNVVEETLRHSPPVHFTVRAALEPVEIAGTQLKPGDHVAVLLAAANRDPKVFRNPDRFDITRPNSREHLAFAGGVHFCVGAGLARMEGEIALRELFRRFPALRLDGQVKRNVARLLPTLESVPVSLTKRRTTVL
ncbi:cytochrome P450 [Allokutzneria oryzae]|uniref:Cytochrome P450 n=1 Tax=Allokutzneria oryzae TaxID=1378989 RepID=A0ABV5ZST3_9PSEU